MRRIWGELVSVDLATRTGTFRKEGTDELMRFNVLPYAELLHHATFGDLQDFQIGERAIFRMHEKEAGEWTWLTYIQDEMNMMNGHKEYFYVDAISAETGQLTCTQANFDQSFIRQKDILIETEPGTRYWKKGRPASFGDIRVGDKLRTKTHGVGKGKVHMCWEVFLDDESLLKFQGEQKVVQFKRLLEEGAPGYVDSVAEREVQMTLFQEAGEVSRKLKVGQKIRVALAGPDRKPTSAPVTGIVEAASMAGALGKVKFVLESVAPTFRPTEVARLWIAPE